MNLLQTLLESQGGNIVNQLGSQFGLNGDQAKSALGALVPALSGGVKNNTAQSGGLDALLGALKKGNHAEYLDNASRLSAPETTTEGNAILGHLFGSKDVSRQVAAKAAGNTGLSADLMKKMLPVVATMVMGGLGKQSQSGGALANLLGGSQGGSSNPLTSFLDSDGDGSMVDDVMGMLFKR